MRRLERLSDDRTLQDLIGRAVVLHFSDGDDYVGFVSGATDTGVYLSSFKQGQKHRLDLVKEKFCGRKVIGYDAPSTGQRIAQRPIPEHLSSPRPFSNSYDREISEDMERAEALAMKRTRREEEDSYLDGTMHRDF